MLVDLGFTTSNTLPRRDTWLDAYADWLFGSATDLIDSQWNRRVKDYEMRLELEDKDRKLAELTRKIQGFATAVQPPPLKTTGPVGAQFQ